MSAFNPADGWRPRSGYQPRTRSLLPSDGGPEPIQYNQSVSWAQTSELKRERRAELARYTILVLGGLGLMAMLWIIGLSSKGAAQIVQAVALACLPLLVVVLAVIWVDRWEPEPVRLLLTAFVWGAGVSTLISLVVNTTTSSVLYGITGDPYSAQSVSAVISAPLVEEGTKGLGVLLIFLIWRKTFDGPVDGVVYAAVVAGGFAFAENISYFVQYWEQLVFVFVVRGVFSPFSHVMFTACTGLAIGKSAGMRSRQAWVWMTPLGLAGAITLHAFWNGVVAANMLLMYLAVEMPLFAVFVGLVVVLRGAEQKDLRLRLLDYALRGWYVAPEVQMLSTVSGRRAARKWAKAFGPRVSAAMRDFQEASSALATLRRRAMQGHAEASFQAQERALLERVVSSRRVFLGQA